MDGGGSAFSPEFRQWSILAFALESLLAVATFLFLFWLGWQLSETMAYVIILVMVAGAVLNIFVLRPWYLRRHAGSARLPVSPGDEPGR